MKIVFTVTTHPDYDQRMIRICEHLGALGHHVTLMGIEDSPSLLPAATRTRPSASPHRQYHVRKLAVYFKAGFGFYAEYSLRLFFKLLFVKADVLCSIDLDTIIPVFATSKLRRIQRVHDAHEYFSQMKEVVTRPRIYRFWHWVEKAFLPKFPHGYTVSHSIATEFRKHYGLEYKVVRNVPLLQEPRTEQYALPAGCGDNFLLYQGSVNEARGFEYLIPAMARIPLPLVVAGTRNFFEEAKLLAGKCGVAHKVFFLGRLRPEELLRLNRQATIGLNLVEPVGLNQVYSLANKFFDYIHAGLPQITMDFPEYRTLNQTYGIALLLGELNVDAIVAAVRSLLDNRNLYDELKRNCSFAREALNWQSEAQLLTEFYSNLSPNQRAPE